MNVTFLATVNLDDLSSLADVAVEISDDLMEGGFDVVSVEPWARPSITPTPIVPINQTQPNQQT